jgi:Ras association domain-containing protein 2/4
LPSTPDLVKLSVQLQVLYHISIFVRDIPYMESLSNLFITRVFEISWPLVNKIKRNETRAPFYSCPDDRSEKTVDSETVQNPLENGTTDQLSPLKMSISKDDTWLENSNHLNRSMSGPDCLGRLRDPQSPEFDRSSITSTDISTMSEALGDVVIRRPAKTGSTAIRRRPGKRLSRSKVKRRCSINGHFYDRETSFFTPPHGSQTSVWVTSLVNTQEVINLMLDKYKVDSDGSNFALFVVRDNGGICTMDLIVPYVYSLFAEQRRLKEEEYPLLTRVLLGPHEDVAKLFLMDSHNTPEVSSEVAQFLNLSLAECRAILNQYYSQEEKEVARLKEK